MSVKIVKFGELKENPRQSDLVQSSAETENSKSDPLWNHFFAKQPEQRMTHEAVTILLPSNVVSIWKRQGKYWKARIAEMLSLLTQ